MRTLLCAVVYCSLLACAAQGQSFRIETKVFRAGEEQPFSENLTLFTPSAVYDFMLTGDKEIVIFDPKHHQFVLLNELRRTKATVTADTLFEFAKDIKSEILKGPKESHFFAQPNFTEHFDEKDRQVTLSCEGLIYQAKGPTPETASGGRRWRHFADWYAYLNATRPGMPPFARLALNEALAQHDVIPTEVSLTLLPTGRFATKKKKVQIHSRHVTTWKLFIPDERRIDKADAYAETFKEVSYKEFRKLEQASAGERKKR